MPRLKIENLSFAYGGRNILDNFNFEVEANERIAVLGSSGCGKTTLLNLIAGLLTPVTGEICVNGEVLFSHTKNINLPAEKRNIGFVFQEFSLWPHMTVFNNVAYPLKIRKIEKNKRYEIVREMLARVGLASRAKSFPHQLSGGEVQRVAIVRALAATPQLLLLDEPLANIDAVRKYMLIDLFVELQESADIPLLYVTHDQEEAFRVADRILLMHEGRVVQYGAPQELYDEPQELYAASFIGENNILPGHILGFSEKYVAVHPEDVEICAEGDYSAEIVETVFRGHYTEATLAFGGTKLKAYISAADIPSCRKVNFKFKRVLTW